MKSFKLFFLLAISVLVFSCNKDDDGGTPVDDSSSIIGTWELIALTANTDVDFNLDGQAFSGTVTSTGSNFDYTITFTETMYTAEGSYDLTTSGAISGIPLDEETETIQDNQSGTYELQDGSIIFDNDIFEIDSEELGDFEINGDENAQISINGNGELVISQDFQISSTGSGVDLIPFEGDSSTELVFRRQ